MTRAYTANARNENITDTQGAGRTGPAPFRSVAEVLRDGMSAEERAELYKATLS